MNVWNILISNCKVMLVTQSAAVAYGARWSTVKSGKRMGGSDEASFFIGYVVCIKLKLYSMAVVSVTYCLCFLFVPSRVRILFSPRFFFFFASGKGRVMWCCTRVRGIRSEVAFNSIGTRFICMRCLNMPLRAGYSYFFIYIFINLFIYFPPSTPKHHHRCLERMFQRCRKR